MKVRKTRQRPKPKVLEHSFDSVRIDRGWFYQDREVIRLLFPDNAQWEYENCTMEDWTALITHPSAGRYLREQLESHPYHPV